MHSTLSKFDAKDALAAWAFSRSRQASTTVAFIEARLRAASRPIPLLPGKELVMKWCRAHRQPKRKLTASNDDRFAGKVCRGDFELRPETTWEFRVRRHRVGGSEAVVLCCY